MSDLCSSFGSARILNDHHINSAAIKLRITFRRNPTCKKIFLFEAIVIF